MFNLKHQQLYRLNCKTRVIDTKDSMPVPKPDGIHSIIAGTEVNF